MASHSITQLTVGKAGSGKSFSRGVRFLMDELLPDTDRKFLSNLPLDDARIADAVAAKLGRDPIDMRSRIAHLPEDELERWRKQEGGPWEYFRNKSIENTHITIDEIHNYCGRHHEKEWIQKWQHWLGEIRHCGATIEFITQDEKKVAKELVAEAGLQRRLIHSDDRPDPFFHIPLGDWYELRAKFTGTYLAAVWEQMGRLVGSKWVIENQRMFYLWPRYFGYYNSYSAPQNGGVAAKGPPKRQWERRTWPSLIWWFIRKNCLTLAVNSWIIWVPIFFMCGGGGWLMGKLIHGFTGVIGGNMRHLMTGEPTTRPAADDKAKPPPLTAQQGAALAAARLRAFKQRVASSQSSTQPIAEQDGMGADVKLVLVSPQYVLLSDRQIIKVGERIVGGVFDGYTLRSIDVREGSCHLDGAGGGADMRLGVGWVRPADAGKGG